MTELGVYHGYMTAREKGYGEKRARDRRKHMPARARSDPSQMASDLAKLGAYVAGPSPDGPMSGPRTDMARTAP